MKKGMPMTLKQLFLISSMVTALPFTAQAEGFDIIGGPDDSTQTIYHCGFLPTTEKSYTSSRATIQVVEHKLFKLGYAKDMGNGVYNKKDKAAVRRFQTDNGLKADGVVGPLTAQKLAYAGHPATNVHRCYKQAASLR